MGKNLVLSRYVLYLTFIMLLFFALYFFCLLLLTQFITILKCYSQAKQVLNSGDPKELMDPNLDVDVNDVQVQRMVSAATLCIDPSARLRPNMSKVIKLELFIRFVFLIISGW